MLAREGAAVVVNDLGGAVGGGGSDPGVAQSVVEEIRGSGGTAVADAHDVGGFEGAGAVVRSALVAFGRVDVLVNNAGISSTSPVEEVDERALDQMLAVHLKGTIGTTKAAFSAMRKQGAGAVVNTVSGAGLDPQFPGTTAYACAKAAVYAFTRVAALEGAALGIRVNAISPLAVTRMAEGFLAQARPGARVRLDPAYASAAVVFLASDLAGALTGRVLRAEGGRISEVFYDRVAGVMIDEPSPAAIAARVEDILRKG
jgi:NAD(P)-dependent dehydrogenase (short-subunit alcohol dehydrogenase family)